MRLIPLQSTIYFIGGADLKVCPSGKKECAGDAKIYMLISKFIAAPPHGNFENHYWFISLQILILENNLRRYR
jgi:beta-galactosidase beta subunit